MGLRAIRAPLKTHACGCESIRFLPAVQNPPAPPPLQALQDYFQLKEEDGRAGGQGKGLGGAGADSMRGARGPSQMLSGAKSAARWVAGRGSGRPAWPTL